MKSFDFDAVTYDGEVYCIPCLPNGLTIEDADVNPIFADSEWDSYPACTKCGYEHTYVSVLEDDDLEPHF